MYLLGRELAALYDAAVSVVAPRAENVTQRLALTANTRNNDVLPAFCRPSMVMSISVDL